MNSDPFRTPWFEVDRLLSGAGIGFEMYSDIRMQIRLLLISLCVGLFLSAPAFADAPAPERADEIKPSIALPLLGGRLIIKLSKGAVISARPPDSIMSAEPSQERQTWIVTPLSDGKLVVFAEETYNLVDPELLQTLADDKADAHPSSAIVGPLTILSKNPAKWVEVLDEVELINEALIALPDQTVVRLRYLVSSTVKNKAPLREFAKATLGTLCFQQKLATGGPFKVGHIAGVLPEGWVHLSRRRRDVTVHWFGLLQRRSEPTETICLYMVGRNLMWSPEYLHHLSDKPTPFTEEPGQWLGRDVSWHVSEQGGQSLSEAILGLYGFYAVHVWYCGDRAQAIVDAMTTDEPEYDGPVR